MEIISNGIQLHLTVAERSKLIKELENLFCKADTESPGFCYSMENITKKFPTISIMFKLFDF